MSLSIYRIDLHIHTCLSPCADDDMIPYAIVRTSMERGLDAIGICDHNSAENLKECVKAGHRAGLKVFAGMEVTSSEEVHLIALFDDCDSALKLQDTVYDGLPDDLTGSQRQSIVNEWGDVKGRCGKMLISSTSMSVEEVVERIHSLGGLAVASHVDREAFSIIGQLGMIPAGLKLDALEVSAREQVYSARKKYRFCRDYPLISSSDSHNLCELGSSATEMLLAGPNIPEMRKALFGLEGRTVLSGGCIVEDLSLHILDIVENSINAGAGLVEIEIDENTAEGTLVIRIRDNGRGMDEELLAGATDPFVTTRTTRRVGLGLSLFKGSAEATGGRLEISSKRGEGTEVKALFYRGHIDMKPLGDMAATLVTLVVGNPAVDFAFVYRRGEDSFRFDTREIKEALGEENLSSPEAIQVVNTFIKEGLKDLV